MVEEGWCKKLEETRSLDEIPNWKDENENIEPVAKMQKLSEEKRRLVHPTSAPSLEAEFKQDEVETRLPTSAPSLEAEFNFNDVEDTVTDLNEPCIDENLTNNSRIDTPAIDSPSLEFQDVHVGTV